MNRQTRRAFRQLADMSDRNLADIGLTRADIPKRFANPFKNNPFAR